MNRIFPLVLVSVAVLGSACADSRQTDSTHGQVDPFSTIHQGEVIYTPIGRSPEGCVLYNIRIPGGASPAALVYRTMEGEFSYGRPDQCVKWKSKPEPSREQSGQASEVMMNDTFRPEGGLIQGLIPES